MIELAADAARSQDMREVVDAAWREAQSILGDIEIAGIGDGGHFDGGFRSIEEGVEHLRVHACPLRLVGGPAIVRPHLRGRDLMIGRQKLRALAGRNHLEPGCAGPIYHLANQRRLIAIRHRIYDVCLARFLRHVWTALRWQGFI